MIGSSGDVVSTLLDDRPRSNRLLWRFSIFAIAVVVVLSTLTARLFYLQVAGGGPYARAAASNYILQQPIPSSRGLMVDRTGRALVVNVPAFAVKIRPADLPYSQRDSVVARLSRLLHVPAVQINETIDRNPGSRFDLVRIATDVPEDVARIVAEEHLDLPGVEVAVEARRQYLYGPLLAQILGYTGPVDADELRRLGQWRTAGDKGYLTDDILGKAGLEYQYETQLRGAYGVEQVERDASGRKLQVLATPQEPKAGNTIQLSIDVQVQKQAEDALKWGMQVADLKRGVVIVMNPQTGEILALVSLPTYDDNLFARGISNADFQGLVTDRNQPLLDHAIGEQYPPGSTFKLVTGTAGLGDGKITTGTILQTEPFLTIGQYRYNEWNHRGFGPLDIIGGFAYSSDTFFYQVAGMVGIDRLSYWAHQYGFGAPTGIDLPGEAAGIIPSNAWKQQTFGQDIFAGETYLAGIGQGYDAVTPLQLLDAYSALANGGKVMQPRIVRQVLGPDGKVVKAFKPRITRTVKVDPSVLQTMRIGARQVVVTRHTGNLIDLPLYISGKTGTAEFGDKKVDGTLPFHTWFVGWVSKSSDPAATDSDLAVLAFAYDSSRSLGNVAVEMAKYFLQLHYHIDKDYRNVFLITPGSGN
jgi:penicillin-binding protein 2